MGLTSRITKMGDLRKVTFGGSMIGPTRWSFWCHLQNDEQFTGDRTGRPHRAKHLSRTDGLLQSSRNQKDYHDLPWCHGGGTIFLNIIYIYIVI